MLAWDRKMENFPSGLDNVNCSWYGRILTFEEIHKSRVLVLNCVARWPTASFEFSFISLASNISYRFSAFIIDQESLPNLFILHAAPQTSRIEILNTISSRHWSLEYLPLPQMEQNQIDRPLSEHQIEYFQRDDTIPSYLHEAISIVNGVFVLILLCLIWCKGRMITTL